MLAYAAHRRPQRSVSPSTLALIVGAHAVALALLITAKMTTDVAPPPIKTTIYNVPLPKPPEAKPLPPQVQRDPQPAPDSFIDRKPPIVPTPAPPTVLDAGPAIISKAPDIGPIIETPLGPPARPLVVPAPPVRVAARANTPADLLRPPYPDSKRRSEEEAVLRLKLSIDPAGRVTAVEPVGDVDPAFLASARSHLIRHWRYRPATEDGRAVASSMTITLRFQLEDV